MDEGVNNFKLRSISYFYYYGTTTAFDKFNNFSFIPNMVNILKHYIKIKIYKAKTQSNF